MIAHRNAWNRKFLLLLICLLPLANNACAQAPTRDSLGFSGDCKVDMNSWRCYGAAQIDIKPELPFPFPEHDTETERLLYRVEYHSNGETWRGEKVWNRSSGNRKYTTFVQSLKIESGHKLLVRTYSDIAPEEGSVDSKIFLSLKLVVLAFPLGPASVGATKQARSIEVSREDADGKEMKETLKIVCWMDKAQVIHFAYIDYLRGKKQSVIGTWQAAKPAPLPNSFSLGGWMAMPALNLDEAMRKLPSYWTLGRERGGH